MKSCFILIMIVCGTILTGCYHFRKSVLFGEHEENVSFESHAIFLDERGSIYPEEMIKNKQIKKSYGQLKLFYEKNNSEELKKAGDFKTFDSFQEHLISEVGNTINTKVQSGNFESVTIILVGYNNKYKPSADKLNTLKKKINAYTKSIGKKTFIVPLFWDGKKSLIGADVLSIFNNANANSYNAGLTLRLIVNSLSIEHINVISHSLGANVVTQLLFNQISKVQDDSSSGKSSVILRLKIAYETDKYRTTDKEVNVGLIAPAIPGLNTFVDYDKRSSNFDKNNDNYKIFVGYNTNDPVLNKFIKPLSASLSSTTFGCDYNNEIDKVKALYESKYNPNNISFIDFSIKNGKEHRKHGIESYMEMPQYDELLKSLYE